MPLAVSLRYGQRDLAMKLIEWIKAEGRSITSVAREWGISTSSLSRTLNGQRWPSDLMIVRSHEVSRGQIGVTDWIETCRPALEAGGVLQPNEGESNVEH